MIVGLCKNGVVPSVTLQCASGGDCRIEVQDAAIACCPTVTLGDINFGDDCAALSPAGLRPLQFAATVSFPDDWEDAFQFDVVLRATRVPSLTYVATVNATPDQAVSTQADSNQGSGGPILVLADLTYDVSVEVVLPQRGEGSATFPSISARAGACPPVADFDSLLTFVDAGGQSDLSCRGL